MAKRLREAKMGYGIVKPSRELFENIPEQTANLIENSAPTFLFDRVEYTQEGIKFWCKDIPYPKKDFPFPEAIYAINLCKKAIMDVINIASIKEFRGLFIGFLFPSRYRVICQLLEKYNRFSWKLITPYIPKLNYLMPVAGEMGNFTYAFGKELGLKRKEALKLADIVTTIVFYDDAYRFRIQDILNETSPFQLKRPITEIRRLLKIFASREKFPTVGLKISNLTRLMTILLLFPKIRKALDKALESLDFNRVLYDESDIYWTNLREDYDFRGLSFEERMKGVTMPVKYNIGQQ